MTPEQQLIAQNESLTQRAEAQAKQIEELKQFERDAVARIDLRMAQIDRLRKALEAIAEQQSCDCIGECCVHCIASDVLNNPNI